MRNKQIAFCESYLRTWNATQAAKDAGYSPRTAYSIGQRLLKNVEVSEEIKKRQAEMTVSTDEVLLLLSDQARGSIKPFVKIEGTRVSFDLSQPEAMEHLHLIKKIRIKEDQICEVELYSSQDALEKLGRHLKLFAGDMEQDVSIRIDGFEEALHKVYGNKTKDELPSQEALKLTEEPGPAKVGSKAVSFEEMISKIYGDHNPDEDSHRTP